MVWGLPLALYRLAGFACRGRTANNDVSNTHDDDPCIEVGILTHGGCTKLHGVRLCRPVSTRGSKASFISSVQPLTLASCFTPPGSSCPDSPSAGVRLLEAARASAWTLRISRRKQLRHRRSDRRHNAPPPEACWQSKERSGPALATGEDASAKAPIRRGLHWRCGSSETRSILPFCRNRRRVTFPGEALPESGNSCDRHPAK